MGVSEVVAAGVVDDDHFVEALLQGFVLRADYYEADVTAD